VDVTLSRGDRRRRREAPHPAAQAPRPQDMRERMLNSARSSSDGGGSDADRSPARFFRRMQTDAEQQVTALPMS
jgi:hypothetical protein